MPCELQSVAPPQIFTASARCHVVWSKPLASFRPAVLALSCVVSLPHWALGLHTSLSKNHSCAISVVSAGTRTSSKFENKGVRWCFFLFLHVGVYVCSDVLCCTYSEQHQQLDLNDSEDAWRICYLEAVVFEHFPHVPRLLVLKLTIKVWCSLRF